MSLDKQRKVIDRDMWDAKLTRTLTPGLPLEMMEEYPLHEDHRRIPLRLESYITTKPFYSIIVTSLDQMETEEPHGKRGIYLP